MEERIFIFVLSFVFFLFFCLLFFVFVNALIMFERLRRGGVDTDGVFVTLRHIRLHFVILFLPTHHLPWLLFQVGIFMLKKFGGFVAALSFMMIYGWWILSF